MVIFRGEYAHIFILLSLDSCTECGRRCLCGSGWVHTTVRPPCVICERTLEATATKSCRRWNTLMRKVRGKSLVWFPAPPFSHCLSPSMDDFAVAKQPRFPVFLLREKIGAWGTCLGRYIAAGEPHGFSGTRPVPFHQHQPHGNVPHILRETSAGSQHTYWIVHIICVFQCSNVKYWCISWHCYMLFEGMRIVIWYYILFHKVDLPSIKGANTLERLMHDWLDLS